MDPKGKGIQTTLDTTIRPGPGLTWTPRSEPCRFCQCMVRMGRDISDRACDAASRRWCPWL